MNTHMVQTIAAMTVATFVCRGAVLFLPKWVTTHPWMGRIGAGLPLQILFLLVLFSLKDSPWAQAPYGTPQLLGVAAVALLQLTIRRPLVSIVGGTALFMWMSRILTPGA